MPDGTLKTFFVGVKGVIAKDNHILLLKKNGDRPFWDVPGGRINEGETIGQTLVRELKEELPSLATITVAELLSAHALTRNIQDTTSLTLLFYRVEATFTSDDIKLSSEHSEYEWMTFEQALEVCSEGIAEAIRMLKAR
jgi:8-oxo-dGTP pyrophosphatase MutT (NUDIX family)